ncbi:ABC transporter substrate-binding protein [Egibacter rhizosphaerae]|uniref:ABC transporter substrate-binding protein n=1 Tax=Egibacter rhizosphaerae TaxID=1670831 RepID=A0A411YE59_9ACTN|nr:ABC transporter substrate-binding protein [Egibacter rhizosphaerae]QBI19476.1 ABC transporter substrate-binding protein [Egibacter rhizosphaerae]
MSRRRLLRSLGATGALAAGGGVLNACTPGLAETGAAEPVGDPERPLRIGYLPITDATPLVLAEANGHYADAGLTVDEPRLFRGWAPIAEAFQARQVDVVHLLMPMAVHLRFDQGYPARIVAWNHTDGSALTVRHEIDSITDLAGGTVAVPFWYSIHNIALQMLFAEGGLRPVLRGEPDPEAGEVKLLVMAPPDMPPGLEAGSIDGYIVADPFNAAAEVGGIGRILRFTGDVWRQHACCVTVVHDDLVEGHPDRVAAIVGAVARAQLDAREDREATAHVLSGDGDGYLPQPRPVIERALTGIDDPAYRESGAVSRPEWESPRIDFQPFPFPSYTEELVRRMRNTEVEGRDGFLAELEPRRAHRELVAGAFARDAIDELGGPGAFGLTDLARDEQIGV